MAGGMVVAVGDVAYAEGKGCTIGDHKRESDYGKSKTDLGKHETRTRYVMGEKRCYAGSGLSEWWAGVLGFLAAGL